MIIKFTKEELRERESIEESYGKLLRELELKIDSLRDDPEPDEKKLAERTATLSALRCVDRVIPVKNWEALAEAMQALRIDVMAVRTWQAEQFDGRELNAEVIVL